MTRPLKKYRVVWIDARQQTLVTVEDTHLETALNMASAKLLEYQQSLQPNERIHKPIHRRLYRLDPRHHQGEFIENNKVANA